MPASTTYTVNLLVKSKDQASRALKKTATEAKNAQKSFDKMVGALQAFAGAAAVQKIVQVGKELYKLGNQVEATTHRFEAFAGGPEQAAEHLAAFNKATDGTVDKLSAMTGASKMLQMGLVGSADEMGTMAAIAVKLGDQTASTGDRIADFSALLANRSIPRLDNFGISSGRVRARVEELKKSGHDLDEAFKLAVLEEGQKSLAVLGDTSELASTRVAKMTAQFENLKQAAGSSFASEINQTVDSLANLGINAEISEDKAKKLTSVWLNTIVPLENMRTLIDGVAKVRAKNAEMIVHEQAKLGALGNAMDSYNTAMEVATQAQDRSIASDIEARRQKELLAATVGMNATGGFADYQMAIEAATAAQDAAVWVEVQHRKELEQQAVAALKARDAHLQFGMSMKDLMDQQSEQAESLAKRREAIEEKHQERLGDIAKRGQARAIKFNAEAEQAKLEKLKHRLDVALLQQSEFTGKTKESTRINKEYQIAQLQEQIVAQEKLLGDYHEGRLVRAGENTTALLAKEEERYQQELAMLEESRAQQEAAQRESLGRMLLQQFEAWAQMKGVSAEQAMEMRLAIAEEYGLIDEESAAVAKSMMDTWDEWAAGMHSSAASAIGDMNEVVAVSDRMKRALDAIPREVNIKIGVTGIEGIARRETGQRFQHGGFSAGGLALVGEAGPEMVHLPPGARVRNNTQTMYDQRTFNYNVTGTGAAGILAAQQRAARRAQFSGTL